MSKPSGKGIFGQAGVDPSNWISCPSKMSNLADVLASWILAGFSVEVAVGEMLR